MRTALITGVTGQSGAYLARLLVDQGYRVVGTTRDIRCANHFGLNHVGVRTDIDLVSLKVEEFGQVEDLLDSLRPDEIYHLASPSSVARSFQEPIETTTSIVTGTVNILEGIRRIDRRIRFLNAASTEMFGDCGGPVDETTPLNPYSPYGVAKSAAYLQTKNYREAYDLFACSAIFSNFESPIRPANFVTSKIVSAACRIATGDDFQLHLGNVGVERDWGCAQEYTEAACAMLQCGEPTDLVIGTGQKSSLEDFLRIAFEAVGLDYKKHIVTDGSLFRPLEIRSSVSNPSKAAAMLGWRAHRRLPDIIAQMVDVEMQRIVARTAEKEPRLRVVSA